MKVQARLIESAKKGQSDLIQSIISEHGMTITGLNLPDFTGCTALAWAARKGHGSAVRVLLQSQVRDLLE